MNKPWMKFYPRDWRADPRLRMCSLAARGLWADLLGYMHEAEPYGHLLIDGQQPSTEDIASLIGRPMPETRKALAELDERGVYSVTETGVIYSRRMVRDRQKAEMDKANGRGGGNPRLNGGVNPQDNGGDKAQIPEARIQNPERKNDAPDGAPTPPKKYAFEYGVIRLTQKDFDQWKRAFSHLDVPAELVALSEWASHQPQWFHAVSSALAKRNREMNLRIEQNKTAEGGAGLTADEKYWGVGRIPGIV